ncbi:MAG: carboxypeptidase-like regulatory domain-containing protein [Planctomycetaceae bacterium]|jgi:hypothetical protein|nr:carboxypeptidase-like regulatory domain-containing protein [Planctomycetaceae bacterium]
MIMKDFMILRGVVLFFILFLTGCGQIKVEGKVSFPDGAPLPVGKVVFEDSKSTFTANIKKDGTFRMGMLKDGEGIPAGKYKVAIADALGLEQAAPGKQPVQKNLVAPKFRTTATSGIEYDIQKSQKDISIVVERP